MRGFVTAVSLSCSISCYTGVDTPDTRIRESVHVPLKTTHSLAEIIEDLPQDIEIRALVVEFEPGRTGRLVLSDPTRSAEQIVGDIEIAEDRLIQELVFFLSQGSPGQMDTQIDDYRDTRLLEMQYLAALGEVEKTPTSVLITEIWIDGPSYLISEYLANQ